jgi:hypothetical protein
MMQEHLQRNASALEAIATITRVITEQGKQTQMEAREGQKLLATFSEAVPEFDTSESILTIEARKSL